MCRRIVVALRNLFYDLYFGIIVSFNLTVLALGPIESCSLTPAFELHVGTWRLYAGPIVVARVHRTYVLASPCKRYFQRHLY